MMKDFSTLSIDRNNTIFFKKGNIMLQRNQLVRVFNSAYPDGKLRYFKRYDKTADPVSHYVTFANGRTEETDNGSEEYWDDIEVV